MPRFRTPEEAARRLDGWAGKLQERQRQAVAAAALEVTKAARGEIRRAVGADMRMSGVGKSGAKVGAGYDLLGYRNPTAIVTARGPLHLVERPTRPHRIPRQRGPRARRRVVAIPGVGVRAHVNHPGTRGKYPFARGVARGQRAAKAAFRRVMVSSLRDAFR